MEDLNAYVSYYLERLEGPDGAHAWHSLREAGAAVLPYLAVALRDEQSPAVRERVVELIWQTREPSAVGTLATALEDPAPQVWKAALDGLVTIGGPSVTALLRSALAASQRGAHRVPADWLAQESSNLKQHNEATRSNIALQRSHSRVMARAKERHGPRRAARR